MVACVARVALDYEGRSVAPGETFGAAPIDALVLRHQGKVTWNRLRVYKPDLTPEPPPVPVVVEDEEPQKPKRRTYRRRDLAPEPLEARDAPEDA